MPKIAKPKLVVNISYRIFEMTDEGHLKEPMVTEWGDTSDMFDHYKGYVSMDDAKDAVLERHKKLEYGRCAQYVVLPFIETDEVEEQ